MPAIAEKYVANKNATLTFDSTSVIVLGGSFTFNQQVADFTSNVSEGHSEDLATNDGWTLEVEFAYDGDTPRLGRTAPSTRSSTGPATRLMSPTAACTCPAPSGSPRSDGTPRT